MVGDRQLNPVIAWAGRAAELLCLPNRLIGWFSNSVARFRVKFLDVNIPLREWNLDSFLAERVNDGKAEVAGDANGGLDIIEKAS